MEDDEPTTGVTEDDEPTTGVTEDASTNPDSGGTIPDKQSTQAKPGAGAGGLGTSSQITAPVINKVEPTVSIPTPIEQSLNTRPWKFGRTRKASSGIKPTG